MSGWYFYYVHVCDLVQVVRPGSSWSNLKSRLSTVGGETPALQRSGPAVSGSQGGWWHVSRQDEHAPGLSSHVHRSARRLSNGSRGSSAGSLAVSSQTTGHLPMGPGLAISRRLCPGGVAGGFTTPTPASVLRLVLI